MVDIEKIKKGDSVHYMSEFDKKSGNFENGVVKDISDNGSVWVVYHCSGEWHRYEEYTGANTRAEDLFEGWKY